MPGTVRQGIVVDVESLARQLQPWRRELPLQHQACIAFPAARTLQSSFRARRFHYEKASRRPGSPAR